MSAASAESSDYSHFFLTWLQIRVPTSLLNKFFIMAHSGKLFTYSCHFIIKDIIKDANEQQCEDEVWKGPESECFCSCGICLTPSSVHPLVHRTCVYVWHLCVYIHPQVYIFANLECFQLLLFSAFMEVPL